jgi:DNA polymerase-4
MPSATADRICPDAVFLAPRFEVYRKVSRQIQDIFAQFSDMVEPLSLDEAFLDVTHNQRWQGSATLIAREIKTRIKLATGLTASAGISYNKFLAKIASDINKPDGLYVITPEQGEAFINKLPVGKFFGVGKVTEMKMHKLGLHYGSDIKSWDEEELVAHFGKMGHFFFQIAHGVDNRPVNGRRLRKSISKETTFAEDLKDPDQMIKVLLELAEMVSDSLRKKSLYANSINIKVRYNSFRLITRSLVLPEPQQNIHHLKSQFLALLNRTEAGTVPVRLLGVGVSHLTANTDLTVPAQQLLI